MSKRANPRLVGAFVLIGIALTVVAVVLFSSGQLFTKKFHFIVFFEGSVGGLRPGAPVKFRGVEIGAVSDVRIAMPGSESARQDVGIPVVFFLDEKRMTSRGVSGARITQRDSVDVLIEQGLRAQLVLESFVTGRRFVELDFLPGTPVNLVNDPGISLKELPAIRTGLDLEGIQTDIHGLLADISSLELAETVISIKETFDSLRFMVSTPEIREALLRLPALVEQMDQALASFELVAVSIDSSITPLRASLLATSEEAAEAFDAAEQSMVAIRGMVDPEAPMAVRLEVLLAEIAASARATRQLTEYLQRNPSSILRGKPEEDN